jgi:dihydrofolate reductase
MGSGVLIQSLMPHGLIDEYVLLIHPLVLGSGHKLFQDGSPLTTLRLVDSVATTKGVVIARIGWRKPPSRWGSMAFAAALGCERSNA